MNGEVDVIRLAILSSVLRISFLIFLFAFSFFFSGLTQEPTMNQLKVIFQFLLSMQIRNIHIAWLIYGNDICLLSQMFKRAILQQTRLG